MSEPMHTPLRWVQGQDGTSVISASGHDVAKCYGDTIEEAKANAVFIVRACNNHQRLVKALQDTRDWLESFSVPPSSTIAEKEEALAVIRTAIADAEKETS